MSDLRAGVVFAFAPIPSASTTGSFAHVVIDGHVVGVTAGADPLFDAFADVPHLFAGSMLEAVHLGE
jgi:hypothetical protein